MPVIRKVSNEYIKDSKAYHTYDVYVFNLLVYHFEESTTNGNTIRQLISNNNSIKIKGFKDENED